MAYIYCITNQINNKRYVGKTVKSLEDRFREHCSDSKKERCNRRPLYDAMNKYGIENFIIEELEEVKDESILDEREKFWIDEMHTYGSNGYNATSGGDGKMLYDYNEIVELFNLGKSQKEVAELLHCDVTTVSRVLKAKGVDTKKNADYGAKDIDQFDKDGNYIQTFHGSYKAAEWLISIGKSKSRKSASNHIIDCCLGKQSTCGGYKWRYKD